MRIMRDLNYTERTWHGVPNIIKNYGKEAFTITNDYVIVTLPFDEEVMKSHMITDDPQNAPQNDLQNDLQNEPHNETINIGEKIVLLIKENPKISKNKIAEELKISISKVKRIIKKNDKIIFIGSSRNGHWEIKE